MAGKIYSAELKRQTSQALECLDRAKSIITYMKLVPVAAEQIDEYEKAYGKVVPPDYRYWLETHGSGRVEFVDGELEIPSIFELLEDDGRLFDSGDPVNCWKRIYLGCGGAPIVLALDSTIVDEFGCAPVIVTKFYSNHVGEVLSSSWPMYVIRKTVEAVKNLKFEQISDDLYFKSIKLEEIDVRLMTAMKIAEEHNNTRLTGDETHPDLESIHSISRFAERVLKNSNAGWDSVVAQFQGMPCSEDQFQKAVIALEKEIALGYSSLGFSDDSFAARRYLTEDIAPRHEQALEKLLEHQRREMRDIAQKGLRKINNNEPQEDRKMPEIFKHFMVAKELNAEYAEKLKAKKLHFRGNIGSFSLISLDRKTPEQGKGGFIDKEHGRRFLCEEIDHLLARKEDRIALGLSRPTREKELQAWIIDHAINHEYRLPFFPGLTFLTSELAFCETQGKIVNDILALDEEGGLVVIELKSSRTKKTLEGQVENFCKIIETKKDFFRELVALLAPEKVWNEQVRKMIVWPDANGRSRNDWNGDIEEVRYKEKPGPGGPQIDYNEKGEIVFLRDLNLDSAQ